VLLFDDPDVVDFVDFEVVVGTVPDRVLDDPPPSAPASGARAIIATNATAATRAARGEIEVGEG